MKHMQRVKEFSRKTNDGSPFLVFEPNKNRPCINEWREYVKEMT
jgi:hypothetical protein